MTNFVKLLCVVSDLYLRTFMKLIPFSKEMLNKLLNRVCNICGVKLNKRSKTYYELKNLFQVTYTKNICFDCYLKEHKASYLIENINVLKCNCGYQKKARVSRLGNDYWSIHYEGCNKKIINKKLEDCLFLWAT